MRLKIITGNLIAVLLLGTISYFAVGADLRKLVSDDLRSEIVADQQLLERSLRLSGLELVEHVKRRAREPDVMGVFNALDEPGRRTRAFEAAERSSSWLADPVRGGRGRPDIVVVVDDAGKVLARNVDRNRMFGMALASALPALAATLADGEARHDAWKKNDEGKLLELAVAAINDQDGARKGALLVGYDFSNGFASAASKLLAGQGVAFLTADKVYASSLDEAAARELKAFTLGAGQGLTRAALGGSASGAFEAKLGEDEYVGAIAPLPGMPSAKLAYAVLANRSTELAKALGTTKILITLTVLLALFVLSYGFMVGNAIVGPIEDMEEGILTVINGDSSLRLATSNKSFGGLAYRINQLINLMAGVAEADQVDEQGRMSLVHKEAWGDAAFAEAGAARSAPPASQATDALDDPALAARMMAEPEDAYVKRVFGEYVAAKKDLGEAVPMTEDKFAARLRGNSEATAKRHGVKAVRFQVVKGGGQVQLQPVLIR